jgi:hypothetical protein
VCLAVARRARGKNISRSKQVTDWVAALPCGSGHTCTCNLVLVGMGADIPALAGAGGRRDGCAHGCCSRGSGGVAQTTAAMVLAKYGGTRAVVRQLICGLAGGGRGASGCTALWGGCGRRC